MVNWIIGLSGAGKTTIGTKVYNKFKINHPETVYIDGDLIRESFANSYGYNVAGRRKNGEFIYSLCEYLDKQDIHVICSVLSLFPDIQKKARTNFSSYFQVYIDVPFDILKKERDYKGIYKDAEKGKITNVVGYDIEFPEPFRSDLIIKNNGDLEDIDKHVDRIIGLVV